MTAPDLMARPFAWPVLAPLYAQPHRVYHDLEHIHGLLREIDALELPADLRAWLEAVAWLHDAYYDPLATSPANETRSADLLATDLGQAFTPYGKDLARRTILATAAYRQDPVLEDPVLEDPALASDTDGRVTLDSRDYPLALFLDLDLHNLSLAPSVYQAHALRAAEELLRARAQAGAEVGDGLLSLQVGMDAFTQAMLSRRHVYVTTTFAPREAQAHANLAQPAQHVLAPLLKSVRTG